MAEILLLRLRKQILKNANISVVTLWNVRVNDGIESRRIDLYEKKQNSGIGISKSIQLTTWLHWCIYIKYICIKIH